MTREEAINELKIFSGTTRIRLSANFWEALNTAIKALEQEPKTDVLDKIRAEIERQEKWLLQAGCNTYNVDIAFGSIKSILAESEE